MADYQRILSYLYRYEKAEKRECPGFVKAEQRAGSLKLTIQIDDERLIQGMELKLYFYEKQGEQWRVWQLDTVIAQEHKEELHLTYPADKLPEGFRIKGQSGVLLYYQDSFYYGSIWIGEEIPAEILEILRQYKENVSEDTEKTAEKNIEEDIQKDIKENIEEPIKENVELDKTTETISESLTGLEEETGEALSESMEDIRAEESEESKVDSADEDMQENVETQETLKNTENSEPERELKAEPVVNHLKKMWINSVKEKPSVDNIFNTAFYEGYRIEPSDLKNLGEEAILLQNNQFLLKGYERYKHLLAGKVRYAGEERYCIGVPGIYENREKYMADIYQFPVFLSLTENRMKTGSFGYWLYLLNMSV